jgi:Co/Zn/Cd efflux system component
MFAALGLFVAGAAVSITHGVQELIHPEPATDYIVGYLVLALSFVLEGVSFLQSIRQAKPEAASLERDLIEHVLATSDPTLRAVFAEDLAALVGLVLAATGLALHQLTGSPTPDAIGSILVGVLLAVIAVVLINRNRTFLVGQEADPRVRAAAIQALLEAPEVDRVTYLRLEIVGPRMVSVIGDVDLSGDDTESHLAVRLRALEAKISASPAVAGTVLILSAPDEPTLGGLASGCPDQPARQLVEALVALADAGFHPAGDEGVAGLEGVDQRGRRQAGAAAAEVGEDQAFQGHAVGLAVEGEGLHDQLRGPHVVEGPVEAELRCRR